MIFKVFFQLLESLLVFKMMLIWWVACLDPRAWR